MKTFIFLTFLCAFVLIKSGESMVIRNLIFKPLDEMTSREIFPSHLNRKFIEPDLVHISIRKLSNDNDDDQLSITNEAVEGKQIPVISDIERIKKVVEIIEFVGEKVGELIDKLELPTSSPDYLDDRKYATEDITE